MSVGRKPLHWTVAASSWQVVDDGEIYWRSPETPEAVIERLGRWRYLVYIRCGLMRYGPDGGWIVFGAKRAERKARKVLDAYRRRNAPRETRVIR